MKSISERMTEFHHLTLPVTDLAVAERFYTEVLGAEVVRRMGNHFSIQFAGGPRIDVFEQHEMLPPDADHPKYAYTIAPEDLLEIVAILDDHGVGYDGPVHQGPPGAAQIYFDDPSGNHWQLVAQGYAEWASLKVGYDRAKLQYDWPKDGVRQPATAASTAAPPVSAPTRSLIGGKNVRVPEAGNYDVKTAEAVVPPGARFEILVNGTPICTYENEGTRDRRQSLGEVRMLSENDEVSAQVVSQDSSSIEALEVSLSRVDG